MYCSEDDVKAEFKSLTIDTDTNISTADVASFIVQSNALIDSYVSKRYLLPIDTSADGFQVLKMISISIVAERIRAIMEVKQSTSTTANQSVRRLYDAKTIMQMLKDIVSGDMSLVGCTQLQSGGGLYSENAANDVQPVFRKDVTSW